MSASSVADVSEMSEMMTSVSSVDYQSELNEQSELVSGLLEGLDLDGAELEGRGLEGGGLEGGGRGQLEGHKEYEEVRAADGKSTGSSSQLWGRGGGRGGRSGRGLESLAEEEQHGGGEGMSTPE